jgi:hypothetical protein
VKDRVGFSDWVNDGITELILIKGLNHSTILTKPTCKLIKMVVEALGVSNQQELQSWKTEADEHRQHVLNNKPEDFAEWQQFVVRAVDERDDPISDYDIQIFTREGDDEQDIEDFDLSVHTYSGDNSLRCFHVNLTKLQEKTKNHDNLYMRVIASSGSELVVYHGYGSSAGSGIQEEETEQPSMLSVELNLSKYLKDSQEKLFYPFTTTLVEIRLNREPYPTALDKSIKLFQFIKKMEGTTPDI